MKRWLAALASVVGAVLLVLALTHAFRPENRANHRGNRANRHLIVRNSPAANVNLSPVGYENLPTSIGSYVRFFVSWSAFGYSADGTTCSTPPAEADASAFLSYVKTVESSGKTPVIVFGGPRPMNTEDIVCAVRGLAAALKADGLDRGALPLEPYNEPDVSPGAWNWPGLSAGWAAYLWHAAWLANGQTQVGTFTLLAGTFTNGECEVVDSSGQWSGQYCKGTGDWSSDHSFQYTFLHTIIDRWSLKPRIWSFHDYWDAGAAASCLCHADPSLSAFRSFLYHNGLPLTHVWITEYGWLDWESESAEQPGRLMDPTAADKDYAAGSNLLWLGKYASEVFWYQWNWTSGPQPDGPQGQGDGDDWDTALTYTDRSGVQHVRPSLCALTGQPESCATSP